MREGKSYPRYTVRAVAAGASITHGSKKAAGIHVVWQVLDNPCTMPHKAKCRGAMGNSCLGESWTDWESERGKEEFPASQVRGARQDKHFGRAYRAVGVQYLYSICTKVLTFLLGRRTEEV
jgi:hypothetical protein